jgi:DNA repair exonuclease SbcCD ATPase subunit
MRYILAFFTILLVLSGCSKPESNPELKDKIYLDLLKEVNAAAKHLADAESAFNSAKTKVQNIKPRTGEHARFWMEYYDTQNKYHKARQDLRYAELRADKRKWMVRKQYVRAFKSHERWPSADSYKSYKHHKEIQETPKSWRQTLKRKLDEKNAPKEPKKSGGH